LNEAGRCHAHYMARLGLCRNLCGSVFRQPRVHVFSRSNPSRAGGVGLNGVKEVELTVADDVALIAWLQGLRRSPGQGGDNRGFSTKGVIAGHDHQKTDSTISCCGVPVVRFRAGAASRTRQCGDILLLQLAPLP